MKYRCPQSSALASAPLWLCPRVPAHHGPSEGCHICHQTLDRATHCQALKSLPRSQGHFPHNKPQRPGVATGTPTRPCGHPEVAVCGHMSRSEFIPLPGPPFLHCEWVQQGEGPHQYLMSPDGATRQTQKAEPFCSLAFSSTNDGSSGCKCQKIQLV